MLKSKKVFEIKRVSRSILTKWKQSASKGEINQLDLKIKRLFHCKMQFTLSILQRRIHMHQSMILTHINQIFKLQEIFYRNAHILGELNNMPDLFIYPKGKIIQRRTKNHTICFSKTIKNSYIRHKERGVFQLSKKH